MNRELSIETKYQQRAPIVSVFQRKNAPPRFLRLSWAGRGAFISTSSESASAKGMGASFFAYCFLCSAILSVRIRIGNQSVFVEIIVDTLR